MFSIISEIYTFFERPLINRRLEMKTSNYYFSLQLVCIKHFKIKSTNIIRFLLFFYRQVSSRSSTRDLIVTGQHFANPLNPFRKFFFVLSSVECFAFRLHHSSSSSVQKRYYDEKCCLNSMKLLTINHSLGNKVIKLETSRTDEMRHPEIYCLLRQTIPGSLLCNKHSFVGGK